MLGLIKVSNYAVIDEVEVELRPGLNVMTGETGAGKSILVDALGLALGERAEAGAVRAGTDGAEISVSFDCPADHPAFEWLEAHGLDADHSCLVRRLVSAQGRSRAFINSRPATLQDLRALGALLVNIHGQSAHQALLGGRTQRELVDHHGEHGALSRQVADRFAAWQELQSQLARGSRNADDRESQLELLRFQVRELQALDLRDAELEPLTVERNRLANVERLAGSLDGILGAVYEGEAVSAHQLVADAQRALHGLTALDPSLAGPLALLEQAEIQLSEAAGELARYRDRLEPDPHRLEWVDARLARIRELAARHRVDAPQLVGLLGTLNERIAQLETATESLDALARRLAQARADYFDAAGRLSAARARSAAALSETVTRQITELGLPHGRFHADVQPKPADQAGASGLDRIEFQVALNPGQPLGPLSRVASGGELSRVSLALEVVSAGATAVPTLVFDEVDAGIGGGVAEIVGRRLAEIAGHCQVLCVTHLPQVASQGQHHYRVAKRTEAGTTRTSVRELPAGERVEELSRMLGGVEVTERARAHAEEMIERAAH